MTTMSPPTAASFASPFHVGAASHISQSIQRRQAASALDRAKIMIVDDEELNILVVRKYLRGSGYQNIVHTSESTEALPLIERERPDLLLLDVMMPRVSGLEILASLSNMPQHGHLPVLILTASTEAEVKQTALELGATDFLTKPIDPSDLLPRVRNSLASKSYQDRLTQHAQELQHLVRQRTAELEISRREVVYCLARAAEFRDDCTGKHVIRVGRYAGCIARQLGFDEARIELLELAAQLHDIGKIGIPDSILKNPGKLSDNEFSQMKSHCEMGQQIVRPMPIEELRSALPQLTVDFDRKSELLEMAGLIAVGHHERWDGTGYPHGLRGESIPLEARITAVADVFDSLSTARRYKPAWPIDRCLQTIREGCGSHFDPQVVRAFLAAEEEITRLQRDLQDDAICH